MADSLSVTYIAREDRYEQIPYRRCGQSGIDLPTISLGLWQNFGDDTPADTHRAIIRRAFDLGVTHFDLANNYGEPYGTAETSFGRILAEDLRPYRDELLISTKAGWVRWPGRYGDWGSRKYLLASLDQSLRRMGLDYVDIFYSHRVDPDTPLVAIATRSPTYDKVVSNVAEVRAREAPVIAIATEGDDEIGRYAQDVIAVPETIEPLSPTIATLPLQLLAYEIAVARGTDVDQPRNLAKSVTVE